MNWRNETAAVARELAHLASTGATVRVEVDELRTVMDVRRDLLFHLQQVLADVRPRRLAVDDGTRPLPIGAVSTADLSRDPVAALQRALRLHPAPRGYAHQQRGDARPEPAATAGGASWAAAGRWILLAEKAWPDVPAGRLTAAERWSTVADVAAFARVVCVLDEQIVQVARMRGTSVGGKIVQSLGGASESGLWFAATETTALAAAGWLPDWTVPGLHSEEPLPMAVRSATDLPAAQGRLRLLIEGAPSLSPQQVVLVAAGQARLLAGAATVLRGVDDERATWATELVRRLGPAVSDAHNLVSRYREPYDAPGRQVGASVRCMQAVVQAAMRRKAPLGGGESAAISAAVERVPAVLVALAGQAGRAWQNGDWLLPDVSRPGGQGPGRWRPVRVLDAEPPLSVRLSAVAAMAVASAGKRAELPLGLREQHPVLPPPREQLSGLRRTLMRPREPSPHGTGRE